MCSLSLYILQCFPPFPRISFYNPQRGVWIVSIQEERVILGAERKTDVLFNRCPTWLLAAVHCGQLRLLWVLPLLWISVCLRKKAAGQKHLLDLEFSATKTLRVEALRFFTLLPRKHDLLSFISFYIKCNYSICDIRMHIECYLLKVFECVFLGLLAVNIAAFTLQSFSGPTFVTLIRHFGSKYQSWTTRGRKIMFW